MSRTLTAADRRRLIRLASSMTAGSPERRAVLAGLLKSASDKLTPDKGYALAKTARALRCDFARRASKRTAGKVSVRFDHGLSVEDIEGMSPLGRVGEVAHLDARRSGAKAAREAISFARSNQRMLNAMSTGDRAISAIDAHVHEVTSKWLAWTYIQLPM